MRRFDEYLPFVPSQEQVRQFISTMPDLKQKAMVAVMYSSGLRIGEVCSLRYEDILRKEMRIFIRHGRNRSSRYAILSKAALDILTQYWFACGRPRGYLFPKQSGRDEPIDTFFLSRHIHEHERRLGWPQRITCHSFRHYVESGKMVSDEEKCHQICVRSPIPVFFFGKDIFTCL